MVGYTHQKWVQETWALYLSIIISFARSDGAKSLEEREGGGSSLSQKKKA